MSQLTIYTYKNCDSCRRATEWLRLHGIIFEERPIRETPPVIVELKMMLKAVGGERRRLFNTSGVDYRQLKLGEKLPGLDEAAALRLLAENGNLVKRPFLLGNGAGLVGFDDAEWTAALIKKA